MKAKYSQDYYTIHLTGARSSANEILGLISTFYMPSSVIDFGCGSGIWIKIAKEIFHAKVLGVDQHPYSDIDMFIDSCEYCLHDLETPLPAKQKYDLAISVEVAEHITEKYADIFINSLCDHSDVILFSAAIPMQGGTGHVNEQPCSYWADKFKQHGYSALDWLRPALWNSRNVEIWYRNNSILYVSDSKLEELIKRAPFHGYPLDVIHPQMMNRIIGRL